MENNDIKIINSLWGSKESTSGEIVQNPMQSEYAIMRSDLANKCADFLQIQNLPSSFKDYCLRLSDIPDLYNSQIRENPNIKDSFEERSLLGMGLVYNHGQYASFIDRDGHTYLMPANEVLLETLKECGYTIAAYGEGTVYDFKVISDDNKIKTIDESTRAKITLPENLTKEVVNWDPASKNKGVYFNRDIYSHYYSGPGKETGVWPWKRGEEELTYDVYSFYVAPDNPVALQSACQFLGEDNLTTQRLNAMQTMPINIYGVRTFDELVERTNRDISSEIRM